MSDINEDKWFGMKYFYPQNTENLECVVPAQAGMTQIQCLLFFLCILWLKNTLSASNHVILLTKAFPQIIWQ